MPAPSIIPFSPLSSKGVSSRNFGLSESEFNDLCEALRKGDEQLFERVFLTHFEPCVKYLMSVDRITKEKAYDASMAALIKFRSLLIAGKIRYGNLRYLLTKMARQTHQRSVKRQEFFTELPDSVDSIPEDLPQLSEEDFGILSRAFSSLGKECRTLLVEFYYKKRSLKDIASTEERSAVAVRKQKSRCVATLKRCFSFHS